MQILAEDEPHERPRHDRVQRQAIRESFACVKHQNMAGPDLGDDRKEYFAGDAALKAAVADNTMHQFAAE